MGCQCWKHKIILPCNKKTRLHGCWWDWCDKHAGRGVSSQRKQYSSTQEVLNKFILGRLRCCSRKYPKLKRKIHFMKSLIFLDTISLLWLLLSRNYVRLNSRNYANCIFLFFTDLPTFLIFSSSIWRERSALNWMCRWVEIWTFIALCEQKRCDFPLSQSGPLIWRPSYELHS